MADSQKLYDGTTEVGWTPLVGGHFASRIQRMAQHRSESGKLYSYQFFTDKWRYEVAVMLDDSTEAEQINTWSKDNTELTFYFDLTTAPTSTKTVHIVNESDPFQITYLWKGRYRGTIILEEV